MSWGFGWDDVSSLCFRFIYMRLRYSRSIEKSDVRPALLHALVWFVETWWCGGPSGIKKSRLFDGRVSWTRGVTVGDGSRWRRFRDVSWVQPNGRWPLVGVNILNGRGGLLYTTGREHLKLRLLTLCYVKHISNFNTS